MPLSSATVDNDEVQNRFAEAPDLDGVRRSSKGPSPFERMLSRLEDSIRLVRNPTFMTAILALLILAAIFVGLQVMP